MNPPKIKYKDSKEIRAIDERILYWIEQLEKQIERLLATINPEDLPPKERAAIAVRMMSQLQWFLAFSSQPDTKLSPSEQSFDAISAVMRPASVESEEGKEQV